MNWGNKLLVAFVAFAALMSILVYKALHTNFELVEKEYYKSELKYQEVIDGTKRANSLSNSVEFSQNGRAVTIQMPQEMRNSTTKGKVWFYCAYNAAQDKQFDLQPDLTGLQAFPDNTIKPGNYLVKVSWEKDGLNYYSEKQLTVQ
jgi:hypothetical protein